jgi:phosphoglycerate dehydrogenase-like enzyme
VPANIAAMTAAPWNLVTLAPLPPTMASEALGDLPLVVTTPDRDDAAAVAAAMADAELLIYDWRASATGLTASEIAASPHLAFIQQPSVGVPGHDTSALDAAGVPLANAAGFNAVAVGEWVLGALFGVARHLNWVEGELRAGRWPQIDVITRGPFEIGGRRVGLVGFGPIAHAVVAPLQAMGCEVSYWSRSRRTPADEHGATYRDLDDLIATSDILVNVIALGDETRGLLSAERLAALPAGAIVVSASRGGIVDELAVLDAVERGHLAGAAFDVYEVEPLPADSPLRRCDRILLTSHTAGSTQESFTRMTALLAENIRRAVTGEPVRNVVNAADPVVRRR